mmetsp:Transcript_116300/g.301486  ORF Transcript_116300/g.301486 Transcript_116300/m.301486 type:complete len:248 (+) Transcript_116300:1785-2528(+)
MLLLRSCGPDHVHFHVRGPEGVQGLPEQARRQAPQRGPRGPELVLREVPRLVRVDEVEQVPQRGELRLPLGGKVHHAVAVVAVARVRELPQMLWVLPVAPRAVGARQPHALWMCEPRSVIVAEVRALHTDVAGPDVLREHCAVDRLRPVGHLAGAPGAQHPSAAAAAAPVAGALLDPLLRLLAGLGHAEGLGRLAAVAGNHRASAPHQIGAAPLLLHGRRPRAGADVQDALRLRCCRVLIELQRLRA